MRAGPENFLARLLPRAVMLRDRCLQIAVVRAAVGVGSQPEQRVIAIDEARLTTAGEPDLSEGRAGVAIACQKDRLVAKRIGVVDEVGKCAVFLPVRLIRVSVAGFKETVKLGDGEIFIAGRTERNK